VTAKILLVDDSRTMRTVMRLSIERRTDWVVCGEAENGEIAIGMVQTLFPTSAIGNRCPTVVLLPTIVVDLGNSGDNYPECSTLGNGSWWPSWWCSW
jgi:chemotaxis response regulator CheB